VGRAGGLFATVAAILVIGLPGLSIDSAGARPKLARASASQRRRSDAARLAARLTAVVVLPTPPF